MYNVDMKDIWEGYRTQKELCGSRQGAVRMRER